MNDSTQEKKCNVLITGDVCQDVYIATTHNSQYHNLWRTGHEWATINHGPGCAALLYLMLDTVRKYSNGFDIYAYLPSEAQKESWTQSLNLFKKFKKNPKDKTESVWRIADFLGQQYGESGDCAWWDKNTLSASANPAPSCDIVVIDEKNLGFRDNEKAHSTLEKHFTDARLIVYRMARPLCKGKLWEKMSQNKYTGKLIVVFTVSDLRFADVKVGQSLSWEQLVEDIFVEFDNEKGLPRLKNCANVIVSFDDGGALLRSIKDESTVEGSLFFRPTTLEGQRDAKTEGRVTGYAYCLLTSIVNSLASSGHEDKEIFAEAIPNGINAELKLYEEGYEAIEWPKIQKKNDKRYKIEFPYERVAGYLKPAKMGIIETKTAIRNISLNNFLSGWTIIEIEYKDESDNLNTLLTEIIIKGIKQGLESTSLPYWKVSEKLILVNRTEIESLRGIEASVREYIASGGKKDGPLSFAMFGPPGSGKSFTVKQMAEENDWKAETLTFNLSQFTGPEDLFGAFHQIRSVGLKGKLPLVFWDEFDSNKLNWLRLFLAPMQDGQFAEGQLTHSIGRALFVFAGGTVDTMDEFDKDEFDKDKVREDWKNLKGPDFVSRLSGFVNVRGLNMPLTKAIQESSKTERPLPNNECKIRRVILLRSLLERYAPNVFPVGGGEAEAEEGNAVIDEGLLRAFLNIREYKHGARSMEAVIIGSKLSGQRKYTRSALPPRDTLSLHVDEEDFFKLMKNME